MAALIKQEKEVLKVKSDLKQAILDLRKILKSDDTTIISTYHSQNAEFRRYSICLTKTPVMDPRYCAQDILLCDLCQKVALQSHCELCQINLSLSITTEEHGYTIRTSESASCPPVKPLLDVPELITTIDTGYMSNVTNLNDKEIWTCGKDKIIKLYNLQGEYISENRNLDICVADSDAHAVVVVNQAGKLRFRYTGLPSNKKESFCPRGITTDSQSQILTADTYNHCIHILDQDGQFLSYIDNCFLQRPWGLCVDSKDNLFVAERDSGKVKKIKYM
ncbi:uncharacterized protein LOC134247548 [Saccostrea cucullata]|uniref:uncharacterized protein LOC134247548 n=1 Tax=Saccostrea cuccullata TaxID=36930 RepID=UPI002ED2BBA5